MPNKIKWIFFDVGGVIVDDDYYLKKYYQYLFEKVKKCRIKITKREILKILKKKGYKLGLIANQTKEMIGFLKKHAIWDLFSFKAISEILNFRKPDIRIFRFALKGGRCKPSEAIMVGDRIDNDIIPAKKLGMKTIRVRKGSFAHSNQEPKNESEKADITINSIDQLLEAINVLNCKN